MSATGLFRLSAFSASPEGGNPAGVWIGPELPPVILMQRIARQVDYSETAFVAPQFGFERTVRYFSPEIEVPFCGHATIATGVLLGQQDGDGLYRLTTAAGLIPVQVTTRDGQCEATLTSVEPSSTPADPALVDAVLDDLRWQRSDLDPNIPPALAFAGARHLVVAVRDAARLAVLQYDFQALKARMLAEGLITLQLVWRESASVFHSRNPFPVGGVVEDPATGAAAAALGGYLRAAGLVETPATLLIRQGEAMGRPSRIHVQIPPSGGILVSGTAVRLPIQ